MLKKISALLCFLCILFSLWGCSETKNENKNIQIVCSTFPIYDWTKNLLSGCENTDITLLLDSATDLHSYQATAKDVVTISSADIFIYIGGDSDKWAEDILNNSQKKPESINLLQLLGEENLYCPEETAEEHKEHSHNHEHHHTFDEHIWLSPKTALKITEKLGQALSENIIENKDLISKNTADYTKKLSQLDETYEAAVRNGNKSAIVVADRNPYLYLINDYSLECCAAFTGCSAESEASVNTLIKLIDKTKELSLNYIIITETSNGDIAETVKANSKDKDIEILTLHSLQSVRGNTDSVSYLELMQENCTALRKALS